MWKGYLTSYRFFLQACFLRIIDFKIKIKDKNNKIKIEMKLVKTIIKILIC